MSNEFFNSLSFFQQNIKTLKKKYKFRREKESFFTKMVEKIFLGTWEVTNCVLNSFERCTFRENDMEGVRFTLTKNGDASWYVPDKENVQAMSLVQLFQCSTYEYHIRTGGLKLKTTVDIRFGGYAGQIFEFRVYNIKPRKRIILASDHLCELDCRYIEEPYENKFSIPFSLLPALEDGYFSDISLYAKNKRQFKVHSTILKLQGTDIDWNADPPPFIDLSEAALGTILHYLYSECLPDELSESTIQEITRVATKYKCLEKLVENCKKYKRRMELRDQILSILNDMHTGMDKIAEYISPSSVDYDSKQDVFWSNPSKLYNAIKNSFREEVVVVAKFVQLCDIMTKKDHNLSYAEQDEILSLLKSKVPIYNQQFRKFLEGLKKIYCSMSTSQRAEVATFIVPEIDSTLSTLISLIEEVDSIVQKILNNYGSTGSRVLFRPEEEISSRLFRIINRNIYTRLITVLENVKMIQEALSFRKEQYGFLTTQEQVQVITNILDFFIKNELPVFLIRLDEIVDVFDEKLELYEFKFFFKVETSKIVFFLEKLREQVGSSQSFFTQACELVQRDSFTQVLQNLGLLLPTESAKSGPETSRKENSASSHYRVQGHHELHLVKSLCTSPALQESQLSKNSLVLFKEQQNTDMEFEVICDKDTQSEPASSTVPDKCVIKAHRAVVASRCDWFRRALLSGMKEAIDKKITIHDTNPSVFRIFLEYLYGGQLQKKELSTEHLLELLLLSDRYEVDSLKYSCEHLLKSSVESDSALYLLSVADQYNANILKKRCIKYILEHNELTDCEEFSDLPISLQSEIFDVVWTQPKMSSPINLEHNPEDMPTIFYSTHIFNKTSSSSSSQENDTSETLTSSKLESQLAQLRSILGESPSKSYLVELILAADYNLERAINFYYARDSSDSAQTEG